MSTGRPAWCAVAHAKEVETQRQAGLSLGGLPIRPGFRGDVVRHPFEELGGLLVRHPFEELGGLPIRSGFRGDVVRHPFEELGGLPIRSGFRGDVVRHPFEELELTALAVEHELVERGQHLGYGGGQLMR